MGGHFAELARLAHTRAMAAFAAALTPMLATPPARMFAATNMLVCVLLLLHLCFELLFPLAFQFFDLHVFLHNHQHEHQLHQRVGFLLIVLNQRLFLRL